MSDRFSRQRGLVRQDAVRQLAVSLQVDSFPEAFLEAMKTLGEQLGAPEIVDDPSPISANGFHIEWAPTAKQNRISTVFMSATGRMEFSSMVRPQVNRFMLFSSQL